MRRLEQLSHRLRARATERGTGDGGFVLLESMVAITVITLLAAALGTFFVNSVAATNAQRARQIGVQVANSAVEQLRSQPASVLVTGRDQDSVTAQFDAAQAPVTAWIDSTLMTPAYDASAADGSGATAAVPTSPVTTVLHGVTYSTSTYLGRCAIAPGGTNCTAADLTTSGSVNYLRAVVAVIWAGPKCGTGGCSYVTAALLTGTDDPTFNLNQAPWAAPVAVNPGNQSSMVGDTVSLQLGVQDGTGVPTITWALDSTSTLPAGLTLSTTGLISGTPTTAVSGLSVTIVATDAFQRTSSITFQWTVIPKLVVAAVADQNGQYGTAVSTLTLTASGGSGTPYTWSDPKGTLPPGLTLDATSGRITGTPTHVGTYAVSVTVTDPAGHTATVGWTWTISYGPLLPTTPSPRTDTVGVAVKSLQLTATGGSGNYTWQVSGLPAGMSATSGGLLSGTPTATGSSTINATVTDTVTQATASVSFSWTIVAAPTVATPAAQTTTVGATVNVPVSTSCPNTPCTYALKGGPAGLTVSATAITGTAPTPNQTYPSVTITVTDADGVAATSGAFSWTVNAAPVITTSGLRTLFYDSAESYDVSQRLTGGTAPYTYTATNLPSWLKLNSSTGLISGTTPMATGSYPVTITATDAAGVSASATVTWYVSTLQLSIPDQWTTPGQSVSKSSLNLATFASGGSGGYSFAVTGLSGSWLTFSGSTISPTSNSAPTAEGSTAITVTVTDSAGSKMRTTFTWWVSNLSWTVQNQQFATGAAVSVDLDSYVAGGTAAGISLSGATGLSYDPTTHIVSGTLPTTPTVLTLTATAVESGTGFKVSRQFTWTVTDLSWSATTPTVQTSTHNVAITGLNMSTYAQKGVGPYRYTAAGLPAGLSIDQATGVISGTPTTAAIYSATVTIRDTQGATATAPITWTVN